MRGKVLNDNVHGIIQLHELVVRVIDRPAFQRLRNISQLGVTSWVYPTATHCRFQHCIGTAYLAGKLVRHLRDVQPELGLDSRDELVAQLAGLLHDVGHGPFSHTWDGKFVPRALGESYQHERQSLRVIEFMLSEDAGALRSTFSAHGLDDDAVHVVKEMICGGPVDGRPLVHGNTPKQFLYEIISNHDTGLDVDKLDYLMRDTQALGISLVSLTCDIDRLIAYTRVRPWSGGHRLAYRDKAVSTLVNFLHLRHRLHRVAYQHKTAVAIDAMLVEALLLAEPVRRYAAASVHDLPRFLQLTDHIFWDLLHSSEPELAPSRRILNAILVRQLYRPLAKVTLSEKPPDAVKIEAAVAGLLDGLVPAVAAPCRAALRVVVCPFARASPAALLHRLLVFDRAGRLDVWTGAGLDRPSDTGPPDEWEVRLYTTTGAAPKDLELARAMQSPDTACPVNDVLVWAFCRWSASCGNGDPQPLM